MLARFEYFKGRNRIPHRFFFAPVEKFMFWGVVICVYEKSKPEKNHVQNVNGTFCDVSVLLSVSLMSVDESDCNLNSI